MLDRDLCDEKSKTEDEDENVSFMAPTWPSLSDGRVARWAHLQGGHEGELPHAAGTDGLALAADHASTSSDSSASSVMATASAGLAWMEALTLWSLQNRL